MRLTGEVNRLTDENRTLHDENRTLHDENRTLKDGAEMDKKTISDLRKAPEEKSQDQSKPSCFSSKSR